MKVILFLLISFLTIQRSYCQDDFTKNTILTNKFLVSAGFFFPLKKVNVQAEGNISTQLENEIAFDEEFGLDGFETTFVSNFIWRFSKK